MSRREELRQKYSAKVEALDAQIKELGEKFTIFFASKASR